MDWLEEAKKLPTGQKKRLTCVNRCSSTRDMLVSASVEGYSAYCFRCGPIGFRGIGYQSLEDLARIKELNENAKIIREPTELPDGFQLYIPDGHGVWLAKAGITADRAKKLGIGWSTKLERIVLPVYEDGNLIYWQARAVLRGQYPKYANPAVPAGSVGYAVSRDTQGELDYSRPVAVTEDILSAIRIGKHVQAYSILGTKLSDKQRAIIGRCPLAIFALDNDDAGHRGTIAGRRQLGLCTETTQLDLPKDPKNMTDSELRTALGLPPLQGLNYVHHS